MKKLLLTFFILFPLSLNALEIMGTVLHINDGDTLRIKSDSLDKPKSVRFLGIDTPEMNFNGHTQGELAIKARDYLRSLIPLRSVIKIDLGENGDLHSRRLLGTVYLNGIDINKMMIASGLAVPYFIEPFPYNLLLDYSAVSQQAYEQGLGIYTDEDTEIPYEFRMTVQGREGTNYVGDLETKVLYLPEEVNEVPPYRRYFIKRWDRAMQLGYTFRND